MENGFYLSTYIHIGELHHLINLMARHEQNVSLWYKSSDEIKLIHYWELERVTGIKKHGTSFYNVDHAVNVINQLLKPYNLTIKDMEQVWGTPELQTCDDYHSIKEYPDVSYHSIAHLFSAIMLDSDKFYNDNIIGLAIDGSPDRVVDEYAGEKNFYSGCVVKNGNVDVFPVFSPGPLWMFAKNKCKLLEGTVFVNRKLYHILIENCTTYILLYHPQY